VTELSTLIRREIPEPRLREENGSVTVAKVAYHAFELHGELKLDLLWTARAETENCFNPRITGYCIKSVLCVICMICIKRCYPRLGRERVPLAPP
jgi:hypothetical protein